MFNALRNIMKDKAYQNVIRQVLHIENKLDNMNNDEEECKKYYSYKSRAGKTSEFASEKPLLIFQKKDISFGILIRYREVILEINCQQYKECINGFYYHSWQLAPSTVSTKITFEVEIVQYCLLLPKYMVSKETNHKNHYTLITQRWMEMNEIGNIELPALSNVVVTINK